MKNIFLLVLAFTSLNIFAQERKIRGEEILEELLSLRHFDIISDKLIVTTQTDTLFNVYNLKTQTLKKFGREGFGPGELKKAPRFTVTYNDNILIYEKAQLEIRIIDVIESVEVGKIIYDRIIEVPLKLRSLWSSQIYLVNDSTIVGMYDDRFDKVLDQKRGVLIFNTSTKKIENYHLKNFTVKPFDLMANTNINARAGGVLYNQNKLIFAHHHTSLIETFNYQEMTIQSKNIMHKGDEFPHIFNSEKFNDNDYKEIFTSLSTSNDLTYILHSNALYGDLVDKSIIVLNSKLEIVKQYKVSKKFDVSKITVSHDVLYGISYNNDKMYKFEL